MEDQRLMKLYEAASYLFITRGYSATKISDIAKRAGIATGSVYNLFKGKKALIDFLIVYSLNPSYYSESKNLPIDDTDNNIIIESLRQCLEEENFAIIEKQNDNGYPIFNFEEMFSRIFDMMAKYNVAFNIINYNGNDIREIEIVYRQYVKRLYKVIEDNMTKYIEEGTVRKIQIPSLHIRNIVHSLTWWAMEIPYREDHIQIPVEKAKEIAIDNLRHLYLKER